MKLRRTGIGLALVAAGSLAVLWLTDLPLGVPGEWVWSRIPIAPDEWTLLILGCVSAAVVGGLYFGLAVVGANRVEKASRVEAAAWLGALFAGGFAWLWALEDCPARPQNAFGKSAWVLYYPAHEGYFAEARDVMRDVPSYLTGYENRMAQGDYFHLGTHPPGLMLFHRACINLCSASPAIRDLLLRTQPASFRDAMDVTEHTERQGRQPLTANDRAALWLATLITLAIAAATVLPLYLLVRRTHLRTTSWWTAALWPLVPALAVFVPKSDVLLPSFGVLFLWLWLEGFGRGRIALCALAGTVFWLGMMMTLAVLPIALAAALLTLWETFVCSSEERTAPRFRQGAAGIVVAAAGWGIPVLLFLWLGRVNLLSVWQSNLRNHAAFYDHYTRTYWKWLLVNPIELVFAVGAPLVFAAAISFRRELVSGWRKRALGPYWCLTATWLILWLSGKNMGEAARLWLIFMPWAVWLAAGFFAPRTDAASPGRATPTRSVALLFFLQMAVSIGTVTRVTGFDFPDAPEAKAVTVRESLPDRHVSWVAATPIREIAH